MQLKTPSTGSSSRKVYLSYDLMGNALKYVKKADIQLYIYELMGTARSSEIVSIYEVPDFDETKLTWGNAPANGEKVGDVSYSRATANTYASLDITSYINKKLAEGEASGRLNFVLAIERMGMIRRALISRAKRGIRTRSPS
ncbi:DNRLRE domain-containing protein [Paenibacillus sp. V4I5]|uniref:CBM96 family carbohydrate-binding protein n=1 Tax=Paenibacillus sp. V4I5 TaxID=3042306 RepID=UPI0027D7FA10|nr:DNRLRE domain-containing protein [Paenibacillus sp. V4I5]